MKSTMLGDVEVFVLDPTNPPIPQLVLVAEVPRREAGGTPAGRPPCTKDQATNLAAALLGEWPPGPRRPSKFMAAPPDATGGQGLSASPSSTIRPPPLYWASSP